MKIGVISDIHGNIEALNAVLKELEKENVEKIICLGDFIGGAGMSEEVIQRILQEKDKFICISGNREKYIIEGMPLVVHDEKIKISQEQLDNNEWIKSHLSDSSKKFISLLPKELMLELYGKKIYIVHYPMDSNMNLKKHIKIANLKENEEMFRDVNANIYLYGHTHISVYNKGTNKHYINPGALGCPGTTNEASYGIIEIDEGKFEYNQLKVSYNVKNVIENIQKIAFPGYKHILKLFYGTDMKRC